MFPGHGKTLLLACVASLCWAQQPTEGRERSSINSGWTFQRFTDNPDGLTWDDLEPWVMPSANDFIEDPAKHTERPDNPPNDVEYAQADFDDSEWEKLHLPHDWAIKGPFFEGEDSPVEGGVGRLPIFGVGWYRRTIDFESQDEDKTIYLDVDGAMSYASVWVNGVIIGGWPYGYASFRLDLTPYLKSGDNQLAIRLEQEPDSSRWYPGAGLYRNVWLTKVHKTHVGQYGAWIQASDVSTEEASLDLTVSVENTASSGDSQEVTVKTDIYEMDAATGGLGSKVGSFPGTEVKVAAGKSAFSNSSMKLSNPKLWGPVPSQTPNMYVAVTQLFSDGSEAIDTYHTNFGVRTLKYASDGLYINGERIYLQGTCRHSDLGSLGAAVHVPALKRQMEMLQDMGLNAIRTSHNPPEPEFLDLADRMGIVVLDEIFDTWNIHKVDHDFATIFANWSEPDLRSFIRRDRNHPSIWAWSFGNELPEQADEQGTETATRLRKIILEEDETRLTTLGLNTASPDDGIIDVVDLIGLNYQGEGKGYGAPAFPKFRSELPEKFIFSTESSSVVSSRGTYLFPVTNLSSEIVDANTTGADPETQQVSAYELYAVPWGASPDKVFEGQDRYPYVAGEFTWTGWDYIGEPTPYDLSRSSYFGSIDLAGFPKNRFYLYQARWAPDVKMAHILPHWNWPDREGEVTPVHVFSSADEAELFINNKTQGRRTREEYEYRFRWDDVVYEAGTVSVVTYKDGKEWAKSSIKTTGKAAKIQLDSYKQKSSISADGEDLLFISATVVDEDGLPVPDAEPMIKFSVEGPGEILTTDNGDPTDMTVFQSTKRAAFRGKALAIVKATKGDGGKLVVTAKACKLKSGSFTADVE
ncbi:glycosyl hydrolases family 2, TIM barrel domain-containing protein [Sarocladium implicatum]|nr:glycosyl hydrolases family 2, TIM barrel domain-containing protein [Sarocladium implicatum]